MYSTFSTSVVIEGLLPEGKCFTVAVDGGASVDHLKQAICVLKVG